MKKKLETKEKKRTENGRKGEEEIVKSLFDVKIKNFRIKQLLPFYKAQVKHSKSNIYILFIENSTLIFKVHLHGYSYCKNITYKISLFNI